MQNTPKTPGQDGVPTQRFMPRQDGCRSRATGRDDLSAPPYSFESMLIEANGQRLHGVQRGDGPLVLLVHGFPESWFSWRHQLPALADAGYRAVALSGRGYGRSSQPTDASAYRITELVADCVAVVKALGESSAVIVGHDWGAQVAWASAWMRPDLFRAVGAMGVAFGGRSLLTLPGPYEGKDQQIRPSTLERAIAGPGLVFYREYLATPGAAEHEMGPDVASWLRDAYYSYSASAPQSAEMHDRVASEPTDDELLRLIRRSASCIQPGGRWRDRFLPAPTSLPAWLDGDVMDFYVAEFERTGVAGALNWYRNRDLNWDLLRPYAHEPIRVPALYIEGDRDPATMLLRDAVARMTARVPQLTHRIIRECGHWIGEERPEETNEALLEFLATVGWGLPRKARTATPAGGSR